MSAITQAQFFGEDVTRREDTWKVRVRHALADLGKRVIPPSSTRNEVVYVQIMSDLADAQDLWEKLGIELPSDPAAQAEARARCKQAYREWLLYADVPSPETIGRRVREVEAEIAAAASPRRGFSR